MATIASLNVYLNAQSEGFNKGIESATRETVRFMMQLDQQARTLGMTADEAKLYNLEMRGVEKALVDVARETLTTVNALKSQQAATDSAKKLVAELQLQAATFHMTAEAAQVYRLQIQGADAAVIKAAQDHALFIRFLREEKAALDAASAAAAKNAAATASSGAAAAGPGFLGQAKGLGQLLKGGGILIGITLISDAVKRIGNAFEDLIHGQGTLLERLDRFSRAIPVYGKIYEAIESIGGAVTGANAMLAIEAERTKELEKQLEAVNALRDARIEAIKVEREWHDEQARMFADMAIRKMQEDDAANRERLKGMQDYRDANQKISEEIAAMDRKRRFQEADEIRKAAKKAAMENLRIESESLKSRLGLNKQMEQALPKSMQFASVNNASSSNTGLGEAFKSALQTQFGVDRSRNAERIEIEQRDLLKKIEGNTRESKLVASNLN